MRAVFLADAHLRRPDDRNYRVMKEFLSEIEGKTDVLVILGDLFEFLIGYPAHEFPHYQPIIDCLRRVRSTGTRIIYCEGNHDFHLESFFAGTLDLELHPAPTVIDLDGKKIHICHGDQIHRGGISLRLLRALLRGAHVRMLLPIVPARFVFTIADRLGRHSTAQRAKKKPRVDTRAMLIKGYAAEWFDKGCDAVITGHFHFPFMETSENQTHTLISLGEWISAFSYAEYCNGTFSLTSYRSSLD